jgi:hypothetical protein
MRSGGLNSLVMLVASIIEGRTASEGWQQDFRRCLIRKQFSDGSATDRVVEIAVRPARESGAYCVAGEDTWTLAIPRAPNQGCRVGWVGHGAYRSRKADRR